MAAKKISAADLDWNKETADGASIVPTTGIHLGKIKRRSEKIQRG
jgi:hypothetical protein